MPTSREPHHKVPLPRQEQGVQANCGQLSHSFGVPEQPALHQAHLRQAGQRQPCRQVTGHFWTGYTSFKIQTCWCKAAKNKFNDQTFGAESIYLQEDKSHAPLSERYMSLADRLAFTEAKQKELASFFGNDME